MKIKNISVGDSVQIKKGKHLDYFKDDEICQVIDIDAGDKYGFDVLIDGQKGLDWVNHKYLKKPEPQLKQLDQSIFDGLDEKWRFAIVSSVGIPFVYDYKPTGKRVMFSDDATQQKIKSGKVMRIDEYDYDTSNWQNSLIERDTAKEPAEVDLSSELTGSDYFYSNITSALLESGSKLVVCFVSDISELKALSNKRIEVITSLDTSFNDSDGYGWQYAIPINNQGEPLTASEVGL